MPLGQGRLDRRQRVCLRRARRNPGGAQPLVRRQRFEQVDGGVEEVGHFLGGLVVGVAVRVEGGDAGAVLGPFVLPKGFGGAFVRGPVGLHVVQEGRVAEGFQDGGYVGVGARGVAAGLVGAIAVVRLDLEGVC